MLAIHWFEIAVEDIERASKFYGTRLGTTISAMDLTASMGTWVAMLPNRGGAGGALVQRLTRKHAYVARAGWEPAAAYFKGDKGDQGDTGDAQEGETSDPELEALGREVAARAREEKQLD